MRKLLYVLFAMLLLGHLEAANACRFFAGNKQNPDSPQEQLFEMASTVFVGHVIRTEEAEPLRDHKFGTTTRVLEATLRIKEVLKGEPPADGKVRAYASQGCNVLLVPGFEYVIFLFKDNDIPPLGNMRAYPLDGYFEPIPGGYVGAEYRVLNKLRELSRKAQ
jgi:hypothetical protein